MANHGQGRQRSIENRRKQIEGRQKLANQRIRENSPELERLKSQVQEEGEEEIFERGPLKMYIRYLAWLAPIRSFLEKRRADGIASEFRYLTLPGGRGIDIGVLREAGLLKRANGKWENVAICDKKEALAIIQRIGTFGAVSQRPLEQTLAIPDHPLVRFFPLDVINLDFCNAVLRQNNPVETLTNLETIQKLIALQRGQAFLLLLTHRLGEQEYSGHVRDVMKETIQLNLDENPGFRTRFGQNYGSERVEACMGSPLEFGLLGIAKYIARRAQLWGYKVEEHFVGFYPRANGTYYMGVNSFEFQPLGRTRAKCYSPRFTYSNPDLLNLSKQLKDQAAGSYSEFIGQLPGRAMIDVHSELRLNADLMKKFTELGNNYMEWWKDLGD